MLKPKIKIPFATLVHSSDKISIKNISRQQFIELHRDLEVHIGGATKRFFNVGQETNYFFVNEMYLSIQKKLASAKKPYYCLLLPTAQARCFVKYFSQTMVSIPTLEIIALLDQKLPILC